MVEFKKYVKLPVEVEAFQVHINEECYNKIFDLIEDSFADLSICDEYDDEIASDWNDLDEDDDPDHFTIMTEETTLRFEEGDFLVRGVDGSIYPVKEKTFWKVYKEANGKEKGALSW